MTGPVTFIYAASDIAYCTGAVVVCHLNHFGLQLLHFTFEAAASLEGLTLQSHQAIGFLSARTLQGDCQFKTLKLIVRI